LTVADDEHVFDEAKGEWVPGGAAKLAAPTGWLHAMGHLADAARAPT